MKFLARLVLPLFVATAGTTSGCYVTAREPEPVYATTEVTSAPVADIERYPHAVYEGRTVYLYRDRWYYRDGSRWQYYRNEPPTLIRHRNYVQSAPLATHPYAPRPAPLGARVQ